MNHQDTFITRNKWVVPLIALTGLTLVILYALGLLSGDSKIEPGNSANSKPNLQADLPTLTLVKQSADHAVAWQGNVRSRMEVKIAPKLNARIIEVSVHPGQRVKQGDVLVHLDDRDLQAAYQAAQAALVAVQAQSVQAHADEKRIADLFNKQAATRQNYDAALAQAQAAQAMVSQARRVAEQRQVMLGENVLRAPFEGIIGERLQEPGDMGLPNQPIVTLLKPKDLRLESAIAGYCTHHIKLGMKVNVRIDAIQQTLIGQIDEITPEVDAQTGSQLIKVGLPVTENLQQGQFGWLDLDCQPQQQALLIPATAVIHYGQLETVKVIEDQQIMIRHIRTGKQYGDQLEVLSGLHEGDKIISNNGLMP